MSHIYRYRSPGILSIKEILYNEIYLASEKELNDPIDMLPNFVFESGNRHIWYNIFKALNAPDFISEISADYYENLCPIEYSKVISDAKHHHNDLTNTILKKHKLTPDDNLGLIVKIILSNFIENIELYKPSSGYSASFSEVSDSMLMWSHYTNSHQGFCLVFRPINNEIHQCPKNLKKFISIGDNDEQKISINPAFKLEKVSYDGSSHLNAFYLFPENITGIDLAKNNQIESYWKQKREQMLSKNDCWDYEHERRIFLQSPSYYIAKHEKIKKIDQIIHYNNEQLVGVIFGARMKAEDKSMIKDIVKRKIDLTYRTACEDSKKTYLFDFLFQQAIIDSTSRGISLENLEIISNGDIIPPESSAYKRLLSDWRNGIGRIADKGKMNDVDIPW
ncbi:DUF2971 domain-containing protein [Cobetia marina]|uniref:DUF2971 domain-containing protein n=1 Tax=Cobetia marina TaxID=28258 RepID=UPI001749C859